ncbi:MAG: HPP family protein [bacterium]
MFKVKDIMMTHVVSVSVDDTIDQAIYLMVKHRISGLPVLDEHGVPRGIVSEFDLLELICEGHAEQARISQYMSTNLVSVKPEDDWVRVADLLRSHRLRRLPVLRDGKLIGIVTRHDLLHAIRDARQQLRWRFQPRGSHPPTPDQLADTPMAAGAE